MKIETVDDIVSEIADLIGVYGACKSEDPDGCDKDESLTCCRVGFEMAMAERIRNAIANEDKLKMIGL